MKTPGNWLLLCGALAGGALATAGIVRAPSPRLPDDAVAVVNGQPIRRADYETALAAAAADGKRGTEDPALRRHVLERLIDEELLVQAALELGLAQRDRRVRADLSSATLSFVTEAPAKEPSEGELRDFFRENTGYFTSDARVEVEELYFEGPAARSRALAARADWREGRTVPADPPPLPLPAGQLPLTKLEQYLGPKLARALGELPVGEISEPLVSGDGYRLLRVKSRGGGSPPRFEDVRELVGAEWRRRASERELRRFLAERRARAKLSLLPELGS